MKELGISNYGKCIAALRPDRTTPGIHWIGGSIDKNGVYHTIQLLRGIARISIKYESIRYINYGVCTSASRPDRIDSGTLWIGRSNNKNGVYTTTKLLQSVFLVYIKNERYRKINYRNGTSDSRPDRITLGTHWISVSIDKNGVIPTTK
jgi:hypothetical protein